MCYELAAARFIAFCPSRILHILHDLLRYNACCIFSSALSEQNTFHVLFEPSIATTKSLYQAICYLVVQSFDSLDGIIRVARHF